MSKETRNRVIIGLVFTLYLLLLFYFLFFSEGLGRGASDVPAMNLMPFREITRYFKYRKQMGTGAFLLNIVGNIAAFIPMGFLIPLQYKEGRRMSAAIVIGALFSIAVEICQLLFRVGSMDVDDVILNVAGCTLGYLIYMIWMKRND